MREFKGKNSYGNIQERHQKMTIYSKTYKNMF